MALTVAPGDHACGIFGTDCERAALVASFARSAFARGDRLFYLADASDERDVIACLDEAGLDGRGRLDQGDVSLLHSSQMGLEGGFDRDRQMLVWRQLIGAARADGHRGLSVVAEMTWALTRGVDPHAVIDYEASSGPVFKDGAMAAVCLYDRRAYDATMIHSADQAHPYALRVDGDDFETRYKRMGLTWDSDARVVALQGEIDLGNAAFFEAQLGGLLGGGQLTVDCSRLRFIDVAGCRLLHRAAHSGALELRNPPLGLERVMSLISWVED